MQSPHMYLLMRARAAPMLSAAPSVLRTSLATRGGGGGHWARPDPRPYPEYKQTRRYRLEDINTVWYADVAPEFWVHLHSVQIQHSRQGIFLVCVYFFAVILPMWLAAR